MTFPQTLQLLAANESWQLEYQHYAQATRVILQRMNNRLLFQGRIQYFSDCLPLLKRWLRQHAEFHLAPWLRQLSQQHQLPYSGVSFRLQRSRWGSCNSQKRISLNAALLFLPRHLVEYVLVHELCHTVHMDHSQRFWRLLGNCLPDYQCRRTQLRQLETSSQWLGAP